MCKITVITSLYNCIQFLDGYFHALGEISNHSDIEVLLLHNAPTDDEINVISKYLPIYRFVRHVVIGDRENLYQTWNRGIRISNGEYLAIWNADDVRKPKSLLEQARALDSNPEAAISYGNFEIVNKYGETSGRKIIAPEFSIDSTGFLKSHHIGCFPMWRKNIHQKIGYFDEQFKLVADLDFQIRVAQKYSLIHANTDLGYFLENTPTNLSSNAKLQFVENTAISMRYGNYDSIHLPFLFTAIKQINLLNYKWFGEFHEKQNWSESDATGFWTNAFLVLRCIAGLPIDIVRVLKYSIINRTL